MKQIGTLKYIVLGASALIMWPQQSKCVGLKDKLFSFFKKRKTRSNVIIHTYNHQKKLLSSKHLCEIGYEKIENINYKKIFDNHHINTFAILAFESDIIYQEPLEHAWPSKRFPIYYYQNEEMEVNIKIRNIKLFAGENSPPNEISERQTIKSRQPLRDGWGLPTTCTIFFAGLGIALLTLTKTE